MTRSPAARKTVGDKPGPAPPSAMGLYTADGARKYLTAGERETFLRAAERADREPRTLCMTLAYGGCRLSEALALTADRVDLAGGLLLFESLKKRRRGIHRAVPVPPSLLDAPTWCTASASCRADAGCPWSRTARGSCATTAPGISAWVGTGAWLSRHTAKQRQCSQGDAPRLLPSRFSRG
jgi:hypothetical protein